MNTTIKLLSFALIFSSIQLVHANNCSNIDLRNEVLGTVRSQGAIGWCFAHAAADVISYSIGKKISVSELGTTYFKYRNGESVTRWEDAGFEEGGWVAKAMKSAINNDVCLEEDLPTDNFRLVGDGFTMSLDSMSSVIDKLTSMKKQLDPQNENSQVTYPPIYFFPM